MFFAAPEMLLIFCSCGLFKAFHALCLLPPANFSLSIVPVNVPMKRTILANITIYFALYNSAGVSIFVQY